MSVTQIFLLSIRKRNFRMIKNFPFQISVLLVVISLECLFEMRENFIREFVTSVMNLCFQLIQKMLLIQFIVRSASGKILDKSILFQGHIHVNYLKFAFLYLAPYLSYKANEQSEMRSGMPIAFFS